MIVTLISEEVMHYFQKVEPACFFWWLCIFSYMRKSFSGRSNEIWPLKMILNFENSQFLTALTQKVLQGIKKSFEYAHWDIKIYWILPDTLRNSTTGTMIPTISRNPFLKIPDEVSAIQGCCQVPICPFSDALVAQSCIVTPRWNPLCWDVAQSFESAKVNTPHKKWGKINFCFSFYFLFVFGH